jgi:DNA-binding transcriptional ArsR family regulator
MDEKAEEQLHDAGKTSPESSYVSRYQLEFSPTEQKVLFIAKDMMKKHYLLKVQSLFVQSAKELKGLGEDPEAIKEAIHGLILKKVVFDGSALTRDEVLANEIRHQMFDLICARPGINISGIRAALDRDSRTILLHLRVLEKFEFVRYALFANNKVYYEFYSPKDLDALYYYLQKNGAADIFKVILKNPSCSRGELSSALEGSIPASTLARKINVLLDNNLVVGEYDADTLVGLKLPTRFIATIQEFISKQE